MFPPRAVGSQPLPTVLEGSVVGRGAKRKSEKDMDMTEYFKTITKTPVVGVAVVVVAFNFIIVIRVACNKIWQQVRICWACCFIVGVTDGKSTDHGGLKTKNMKWSSTPC